MSVFYVYLLFAATVASDQTFRYEQKHNFGLGRPIILNYRRMFKGYPYPEPLPTSTSGYIRSPYKNIYQGVNRKLKGDIDKRVYNKKFKYAAKPVGHHLYCQGVFDCVISHMAIETNGSIPILLRGGVGYKYFGVVIKAYPGEELSGRVRAYCPSPMRDGPVNRHLI